MYYEETSPSAALRDHVLALWTFHGPAATEGAVMHHVPPDGCMGISVAWRGDGRVDVAVVGAHDSPLTVRVNPGDRYWGVRFWPDAGAACLHLDAVTWVGRIGPAQQALGDRLSSLTDALAKVVSADEVPQHLQHWCCDIVAQAAPLDPAVRLAVVAIAASRGTIPIREVPATAGTSARTLLRRFRAAIGLTLKRYAKVRRFREAAAQHLKAPAATWSTIAAEVGYADHAHLTRDFRDIVGAPPREVARLIGRISHGAYRP